jgi:hypothetical protein
MAQNAPTSKTCARCKIEKPAADFCKNITIEDGLSRLWGPCVKLYTAERKAAKAAAETPPAPAKAKAATPRAKKAQPAPARD